MKNKNQFQQGDVVLKRISQSLNVHNNPIKSKGKCTLAYGEQSGHHHTIEMSESDAELIVMGEKILLNLHKQGVLTHQEHNPITLEPGLYEFDQVVEKDWLDGMVRKVID